MEDNTCYCPGEFLSTFWRTKGSSVPPDILEFDYSFGYDVKRLFNLVLIDPDVLVFASGNILHFYRISTKEVTFRRSADGGGIGFITKNPNPQYNYLTVAENGTNPRVIIYKFPELKVISILNNAARRSFTCVSYRSDGEVLATQAGEPDYMLTIWNWKSMTIILRAQSFQNDVLNVVFSPHNPSLLTTCGLGHIKFWKMARTFTGLKLQGDLGRFGKTEFSDIYAIYPLADEKVISGCKWGNMLLWDDGLIKLEVCRKNRKPCHDGPITHINMDKGEVMTVGMDGYIRIWFWETVEIADPPDDDRFVEIEPINEFRIGPALGKPSELRQLIRINPNKKTNYMHYAQDGNGGIWLCDINVDSTPEPPKQIFQCHSGRIEAIDSSPVSPHFASLCSGGMLHLYNYLTQKLLFVKIFPSGGSDLLWVPGSIDASGSVIIMGFKDGVIRQVVVNIDDTRQSQQQCYLIEVIKSHSAPITKLSINPNGTILISGSEDQTIFIHQLAKNKNSYVHIIPIGFLQLPSIPKCFNWRPNRFSTILIGGLTGEVLESDLPEQPRDYTKVSYSLQHIEIKKFQFNSVKSHIRRKIYLQQKEVQKLEKRNAKMEELRKLREANPGIEVDEEVYLADSESEEELEPLYIPKIPNPVLWLRYTPDNTIWLSMGGYDAGYIYECKIDGETTKTRNTLITGADDIEIHSYLQYGQYLIFGMQDGSIRINAVNPQDFRDLSDYWKLSMHDNFRGIIPKICTSYNGRYIFTIGYDNNIFSFKWNGPLERKPHVDIVNPPQSPKVVTDIEDINFLSLEQQKIKNESDRRLKLSNERKQKVLDIITDYKIKFKEILKRNKAMPKSQQLTSKELELDARITSDLTQTLDEELQLIRRKLAYQVEKSSLARKKVMRYFIDPLESLSFEVSGIRENISAKTFRIRRLDKVFYNALAEVEMMIRESHDDTLTEINQVLRSSSEPDETEFHVNDSMVLASAHLKLNPRMKRLLDRYRNRQHAKQARMREWVVLNSQKPDFSKSHPDDILAIEEAERTIGDYKLKTSPDYIPLETENTALKYKDLLLARERLFNLRNDYNKKVLKLRMDKEKLYQFVAEQTNKLAFIHEQIPANYKEFILPLPQIDEMKEYPENNLLPLVDIYNVKEVKDLLFKNLDVPAPPPPPPIISVVPGDVHERLEWQILSMSGSIEIPSIAKIIDSMEENPKIPEANKHILEEFASQSFPSPWQVELRNRRIIDKIIEQNQIIQEVNDRIYHYDKEVEELIKTYVQVDIDGKLLEERIMTMNQELFVLRDCERLERVILKEVESAAKSKNQFQSIISSMKTAIEDNKKNIEKLNDQVKSIQTNYIGLIKGNKFYDFLRRIFKKKYKPPKEPLPDGDSEESSESETSSSEEEDERSDDSLESAPIRFDENFCPPGCDKRLYDLAFTLRSERHSLEQNIHQNIKTMDERKREIDEVKTRLKDAESLHLEKKRKLLDFMRERQKVLNKIKSLVVLRMDQLQYIKEGADIGDTKNTLLFNADYVIKLYLRVGQLGQETLKARRRHKINIVHLQRMDADCKFMDKKIAESEAELKKSMMEKFGMIVNLDEVEEAVLRKYIFDMKMCLTDEKKEIDRQMAIKKKELVKIEEDLIKQTQIGTEKLNILTVLQEEKNFLSELLYYQEKLYEKMEKGRHLDFRKDINKLQDILLRQDEEIEFLEKEIRTLRLRGKPLQPPVQTDSQNPEYLEVLPNPGLYEDIVYENVTETKLPTRGINPDTANGQKIVKIVKKFLVKTVGQHMSEEVIRKYTSKISNYLGLIAHNFECDQAEKVIECIVENFQAMIPNKYLLYIKPRDIKDLFTEVIQIFDYEKAQVSTINVLNGIISNALDICSNIKTMNYTQEIVSEVFREIIEVLSMDEVGDPKSVEAIYKGLRCIPEINPKCINIERMMENLVNHARDNLLDEFDLRTVREVVDKLVESLFSFRGRAVKPERPME